jgi:Type IV secretion-system coupling protein DNA-binding domain
MNMWNLFPDKADELLDVAALPRTDKTELNYRTRPLSADQELRFTLLLFLAVLPALTMLGVTLHFSCSLLPVVRHAVVAVGFILAGWILFRRLTGALQKIDLVLSVTFLVAVLSSLVWTWSLHDSLTSFRCGLLVCWIASSLIARQAAAWILVAPTVDHETMKRWRVNLPRLIPHGLSLDCPEILTYTVSPLLLLVSWSLSLWLLTWIEVSFWFWPVSFAASVQAVWLVWHLVAIPLVPFPHPDESLRATWRAIVLFVTYDIHQTPAAGIFRFPTRWLRSPWHRWTLLVFTLLMIGFAFGTKCPHPFGFHRVGDSFSMQLLANLVMISVTGPLVLCATLWLSAGTLLARFEKELSQHRDEETTDWDNYIDRIINSDDALEREHLFLGVSETSDYPILVHQQIHDQHGHILGDSGASKTSLAMGPQATQLIARADSTVVIVDLKGDKALFESCRREAARTKKLRFRWISNEVGKSTFGFNPFMQSHNRLLSVEQLTQQLLQGLSLDYGIQYGAGFFTAMNEIVLNNVLQATGARSFRELSEHLADRSWYQRIGYEEDWKQARHLGALVQRLSGSQAINVVPDMFADRPEVHERAIDASNLLDEPQVIYLWLRSAVEPTNAPAIARLFLWSVFTAASHQPQDQNRVYFFIDEMQQIISDGIKLIFEQFRDLGGTIIAAHQTAGQLRRQGTDLGDTIDSCTAVKQIFRASDLMSLDRLEKLSGTRRETTATWHQPYERGSGDLTDRYEALHAAEGIVRVSEKEQVRYNRDTLQAIGARQHSSLVRFTFGSGYTQFAGRSVPMKSQYHISFEEYLKRRQQPWPNDAGAFLIQSPSTPDSKEASLDSATVAEGEREFGDEFEQRGQPATM